MHIEKFQYQGDEILFDVLPNEAYINATKVAQKFGKLVKDYLKTESTKEYIEEMENTLKAMGEKILSANSRGLVIVKKGGKPEEQGTWIHNSLAVDFARWLNPKFAVWCDIKIKEILSQKTLFEFDGKSYCNVINGYKSQIVQKNKLIKELRDESKKLSGLSVHEVEALKSENKNLKLKYKELCVRYMDYELGGAK